MPFRPQDLHDFDVAREIRIETHTSDRSTRSTTIWVVVVDGQIYVRSVRGAKGVWYQEALANPNVTIDDRGRRLETKAIPVRDPETIRRVSEALKHKYASDEGLDEMLDPDSLSATALLCPGDLGHQADPSGIRNAWSALDRVASALKMRGIYA